MKALVLRLFAYLCATPVIEAMSPELEPVDDLKDLRRMPGIGEKVTVKANLAYFADHKPQGYAFTFGVKK